MQATAPGKEPRNLGRSTGAIVLGFVAVVVLSLSTDELLHLLKVYPPWGQPMHEPGLNLQALSYRIVYTIVGSYLAARFAPRNPMRHAMILGAVSVRRPQRRWPIQAVAVIIGVYFVALVVAMVAMTGKPGS